MWEIRSIDLGARAAFVATLRFYIRALVMKKVSAVDVRFVPIADIRPAWRLIEDTLDGGHSPHQRLCFLGELDGYLARGKFSP